MKWPSLVDKRLCKTPISVNVYAEGNDEDGAPVIAASYTGTSVAASSSMSRALEASEFL